MANTQPFILNIGGSRFIFPELRFAITRAQALTRNGGLATRATIAYKDDPEDEVEQLGVVVLGEWFPAAKPISAEELERAIAYRGFAFHLLSRSIDRLRAHSTKVGMERGWSSPEFQAIDKAVDIITQAQESVADEMSYTERAAHYKVERLTVR